MSSVTHDLTKPIKSTYLQSYPPLLLALCQGYIERLAPHHLGIHFSNLKITISFQNQNILGLYNDNHIFLNSEIEKMSKIVSDLKVRRYNCASSVFSNTRGQDETFYSELFTLLKN